ncbi:MAG: MotA/TolQ/ExbB proton channel family protein [Tepidisphaeraceae bacterium]|jgi:biopolymer transport protein ExbB
MHQYASSRLRLGFLAILIVAAVAAMAPSSSAQVSGDQSSAVVPHMSVFSLVMEHRDPVFWVIMALSITGMTLIIQGVLQNRASVFMPERSTEAIKEMIRQRRFQELMDFTERDPSFISRALNPALKRAPSFAAMKEAMETAIGEQTAEQFRKIEYLNIIGNLGPLLGLLGTVLGMIDAFLAMYAASGAASPKDLAFGISQALCHTMLGLMLAVPCLAAFGVLRTVVDRLTVRGALLAEEILLMIKPADAKPAAMSAQTAASQPTFMGNRQSAVPPVAGLNFPARNPLGPQA